MIEGTQDRATDDKRAGADAVVGANSTRAHSLIVKCPRCRELLYVRDWQRALRTCQSCGYHFRLSAPERIASLMDAGSFVEIDVPLPPPDPLHFMDRSCAYVDKLAAERKRTGLGEAAVIGTGCINGHTLVLAVMDFHFIGGSMGLAVGEKITCAIELAQEKQLPLLIVSASGGARMQEGVLSLMQMAKTTAALVRLDEARLPFISLLTDPTTGGVLASFAMLGDVIVAEPGALIGFAGPRVIEQFMHQTLPPETNTAEFLLEHGMVDAVVPRTQLRSTLTTLLNHLANRQPRCSERLSQDHRRQGNEDRSGCSEQGQSALVRESPLFSSWQRVALARHKDRPHTLDYIEMLCKDFIELRGDRCYANDEAIIGGLVTLADITVLLIGQQKGRGIEQRQKHNAGMPHPEGYRKAQRLMRLAEKFGWPVICLIDTPGAYPGLGAEQRGQAQAIAECLKVMTRLRVPTLAVIIGEGGSGGALALGVVDRIFMLEHSIYTVASPEAAASILWRDNTLANLAAEAMRITAPDLLESGVIDGIIPEPAGGSHLDPAASAQLLQIYLHRVLRELTAIPIGDLLRQRYRKLRGLGNAF